MPIDYTQLKWKNKQIHTGLTQQAVNYIDPLKLQGDIILGDFVFNTIDEYGIVWTIQDIEGWWGPPEPEVPDYQRGNFDGSYDVRGRWNARELTLSGTFLVPDSTYVPLARQRLVDAANLVYRGTWLRVNESNYNKVAWVRLSGQPKIQTVNARGRTEFQIGLRAPDPIKYSWNPLDGDGFDNVPIPALSDFTPGEAIIENVGNTPVPISIQIAGPTSDDLRITNEERSELLTIIKPLTSGKTLIIDTYDNSVYIYDETDPANPQSYGARTYVDPIADWIKLGPGFNTVSVIDYTNFSNSTNGVTIFYRSGWIG